MKVLKSGNTYKEIECDNCGALLSYCRKDIKSAGAWNEYNNERHWIERSYITCPECQNWITVGWFIDGIATEKFYEVI